VRFFLITNSPDIAAFAVSNGVDRIFVDLETIGKADRQGHLDTVMSQHTVEDVALVRSAVPQERLMVRINPVNIGTPEEVEQVISAGADVIMLPMFRSPDEVEQLAELVGRRTKICLLVETVGAMNSLEACVGVSGVDEVHIGLNDLSLELGQSFMFLPFLDGTVERMARTLRAIAMPFGIGGVARVGEGLLPAELIIREHVRLGSSAAILSRTFHRQASTVGAIQSQMDFRGEIMLLRNAFEAAKRATVEDLEKNSVVVRDRIRQISISMPQRKEPLA
jgi:2-keto-3-deoxy-L-rhamnonate aldolase RhmA